VKAIEKLEGGTSIATSVRWADYKDTFIGHLLRACLRSAIMSSTGGNRSIVNRRPPATHGPSWRWW